MSNKFNPYDIPRFIMDTVFQQIIDLEKCKCKSDQMAAKYRVIIFDEPPLGLSKLYF